MVAVDGGGNGSFVAARLHELKQGHLCGRVLHGHAVGAQGDVGRTTVKLARGRVVEVAEQYFISEGERPGPPVPDNFEPGPALLVNLAHQFLAAFYLRHCSFVLSSRRRWIGWQALNLYLTDAV
jgi:hypothetical protein